MMLSILGEVILNYFYCSPFPKSQSIRLSHGIEDAYRAVGEASAALRVQITGRKLYIVGREY